MSFDAQREQLQTTVTLIEPEDAACIQYRPSVAAAPTLAEWKDALPLAAEAMVFQAVVQTYPLLAKGKADEAKSLLPNFGVLLEQVQPGWDFLRAHTARKDHELALWVVGHHGNAQHRAVALAVLLNFADADLTWWHVADALRDPDEQVHSVASMVLGVLTRQSPRPVDWRPAAASLRPVLAGTNLMAYQTTLRALVATRIAPDLAADLLPGAADLLVAHSKATHEPTRKLALDFLKHLSGQGDHAPEEWQRWLEQYRQHN